MAMSTGSGEGVKAEPNVTPMIDVMLVLLIIFMLIVPALMSGFNAPEDEDQLLGIDSKGQYFLNKQPIRNDQLAEHVKRIYDARTIDKILYVRADRTLPYGKIQDAIDVVSKNGVRVTGMITEQLPNTESSVAGDMPAAPGGK
jgi:biopolymer transport protein ExbD